MNQEVAVGFGVFIATLAYTAIWRVSILGGELDENAGKIKKCRAMLQEEAVEALRAIDTKIAEILERAGGETGLALIRVDPDQMLEPTQKFVDLVRLDDAVERLPLVMQRRSRYAFRAVLAVAVVATVNLYIALFLFEPNSVLVSGVALGTLTTVLVVGGTPFLAIISAKRALDRAFIRANQFDSSRAGPQDPGLDWGDQ